MEYLRLYLKMQKANIRSRMAYPFNFFLGIICVTCFGIFSTLFIWVLTRNFPSIAGWNFYEILFISSFNMLSYSLGLLLFIHIMDIDHYVRNAEFDRILVRPMNALLQFASKQININSLGTVIYAVSALIYAGVHISGWSAVSILYTVLLIICGTIVSISIHLIIGSTAFITLQSGGLFQMLDNIYTNVDNYPVTIFPKWVQFFLTFILPIGFIGFYPSAGLLGKGSYLLNDNLILICLAVSLILSILSYIIWHVSIKFYSGAGS
ncbi:ABC-2 family transporter protein [Bacillus mycoides]|uniref:ABC transporter permease n=1 Tax=Bacillus thuringiensis serovar navarrensis TaxID=339658 RepID=A0A243ALJ4_BACTU|nr:MULTISPECIES: ABC-2 family transporter protein [Bacillus]MBK5360468.1 ABC-2 family transporter protein [Bacillus sp. TH44]OTY26793.1 hypothetical protein BK732_05470 [Bacillus thuringiensis serovar navarrensis]MBK5345593.1 ABC-2 family transporter protein [Bacillus sp. TH45]MBK5367363.1 ABC-2 family transporter protein [Bacillus sp. TH50]MBK5452275.1 ABC-2 family transporter protein [Bacillus sp. TH22]